MDLEAKYKIEKSKDSRAKSQPGSPRTPTKSPSKRLRVSSSPSCTYYKFSRHARPKTKTSSVFQRRRELVDCVSASLRKSQYERAFRQILASGRAAGRAFNSVVQRQTKSQMTQYMRRDARHFPQFTDSKSVVSFCWSDEVERLSKSLPTLYSALSASMPQKLTDNNGQLMYVLSSV